MDYSSRRGGRTGKAKNKRKAGRAKPAARRAQKRTARGGPPGWLWFVCGLCLATAIAAGLYIFVRPVGGGEQQIDIDMPNGSPRQAAPDAAAGKPSQAGKSRQKPRFSFYKMLPNYEVVIPQEHYSQHAGKTGGDHGQTPQEDASERPAPRAAAAPEPTTPKVSGPGHYVIQAGSFSTHADADRRKAELALLGVSAQIVDINLSSGKTVYRVQSDTIDSSNELNTLLKRLRAHRIDTLVMRAKD